MSEELRASGDLRQAMSRLATGVTVVTATVDGHDHAMTANSFTSVSLDPPLVLLCVQQETGFHDALTRAGQWGVSILREEDRPTAAWLSTFGRPLQGQLDRVAHHRGETGVVLLDAALATLECHTVQQHVAGDHVIVVAEVLRARHADRGQPLVYYRSRYTSTR
ncbi:flavin reductase family protein [Marihabitans asiaticum]|uniref:Flavin reductase (DIM6/NTAB) family NADH-FMN oxidoreductase RutF n=1 Tax=Marihabitans asiaticum TaxID=415218 RepID=A0A560WHX6_9MICO|nr:flavin reductase family protein [Marihabitans asiaticum]TWD17303.1 flavin reductase (DIM6/NTAB) family NADH-FMN oxidoreductase RutF [Marihabitans asiaticum]